MGRPLALLLSAAALLACSKEPRGPAGLSAVRRSLPAQQAMDFVFVQRERGGGQPGILKGGMSKATVSVEENRAGEVDVTISEECPGCAGSSWSSSIWMAAFLASTVNGDFLADHKFSVRARGFIDGPSAGASMAATMLAMLRGAPVKPKVAMTGAINPDLSIGPVGGIPQKLLAAVQAGMEQFCYPAPQASVWDDNFHSSVEVQQLAQRHGITAKPVKDLREAYQCLTGQALPADGKDSRLVEADAMKDSFGQLRAISDGWLARSRAAFEELKGMKSRGSFTAQVVQIRAYHDAAERNLKLQRVPAAYHKAVQAAAGFEVLLLAARAAEARQGGDAGKLLSSLEPLLQVEGEQKALQQQLAASKPGSVGAVLNLVWCYAALAQSAGFLDAARATADPGQKLQVLVLSKLALEHGKDVWNSWKDEKVQGALRLSQRDLGVLARSYLSAASANFQYHRALDREAGRSSVFDPVVMRQLAFASERLQEEGMAGALAALGASMQSYVDSSYLMASGYLRQFYEADGRRKAKAPRPSADADAGWLSSYSDLLDYADLRARESATRAQGALQAVPTAARFHYLAGRDKLIHGDDAEKQRSLHDFWFSSALSDLAVQLAKGR